MVKQLQSPPSEENRLNSLACDTDLLATHPVLFISQTGKAQSLCKLSYLLERRGERQVCGKVILLCTHKFVRTELVCEKVMLRPALAVLTGIPIQVLNWC